MPSPSPYLDRLTHDYLDLVYSSTLRRLRGDSHRASDITQAVMLVVLRKAEEGKLPRENHMAGWLIKITGYAILQQSRAAARRAHHESAAAQMNPHTNPNEISSTKLDDDIRATLDDSLLQLGTTDREVLIRRHLQGQSLAQIGAVLRMQENTVGKRISRALLKLRIILLRRGVTAPAAAIVTVLTAELTIKAPAAATLTSTIAPSIANLAKTISWKLALVKLEIAALLTVSLALFAGTTAAVLMAKTPPPESATPPPLQPIQWPATRPTITITRVIDGPNDAILKELLAGLKENQPKLHLIHLHATLAFRNFDSQHGIWNDPHIDQGEAWLESGPMRRYRQIVSEDHWQLHTPSGNPRLITDANYVETWNGTSTRREYQPPVLKPTAETFNIRQPTLFAGADFSMQLPWDEEHASALSKGTWKTIDRNPLAPATLAQMKLTARRVILAPNQTAMELTVNIPDSAMTRTETFWFDPDRGYGLLARHNTQFLQGQEVLNQTLVIESMTQAAPGIFYPTKAQLYWESVGDPMAWEVFTATQVTANEPIDPATFTLQFTPGIPISHYKYDIRPQPKPTTTAP